MKGIGIKLILSIVVALLILAVGYLFVSGKMTEIIQNIGIFRGLLPLG
jgi:cell division protein FtsL